jgi:arsenite oxidase small subunit
MSNEHQQPCISRRNFMLLSGASVVTLSSLGFDADGQTSQKALYKEYPRTLVGRVSELERSIPKPFHYPHEHPFCRSLLFKLDTKAGGGVGPDENIVAFNQLCTHMGGMLEGQYNAEHQVLGPCPIHLTTFDVTRHGMVVSGQATQGLPQILLEIEGDAIYATGVMGLIYGYHENVSGIGKKG